jgi:starch-binding outer membrane protein, SusD/RagB family
MRSYINKSVGTALAAAVVLTAAGCDDFLEVRNPNVVVAELIDPVTDAPVLSRSAFQNFATYYGSHIVYAAWFTHEAWVGDTFPTRNEYGRRLMDDRNTTHNGEIWFPLSRAVRSAEDVLRLAGGAAGADQSVDIARASMTSGFSMVLMAEGFCRGTVWQADGPGPVMNTVQMLDMAVERFNRAITTGAAAATATGAGHTAASRAEADSIVRASRVGLARAHLQAGRNADAIAAATPVATGAAAWAFRVAYVDDQGNRGRLGNTVFFYGAGGSREALVVPPIYRALNDPRVPFADAGRNAQDGVLRLWTQRKYPAWNSPIRLASALEARYIIAEARLKTGTTADAVALINERRAVGGEGAFTGTTTESLLAELMRQRSIDFWLEGKRMGDFRRNPGAVPWILGPGDAYYKPQLGAMGNDTCWPIPAQEYERNPNVPA